MGGGIFNLYGTVNVVNSTFANNSAKGGQGTGALGTTDASGYGVGGSGYGGAIFNLNGSVTLLNATLANDAVAPGQGYYDGSTGGAVYNISYGATPSGGSAVATLVLGNTILAGTSFGMDDLSSNQVNGTAVVNVVGPTILQTPGTGLNVASFLVTNPLLGSLQNSGGDSSTMAPASNSPALGAGDVSLYANLPSPPGPILYDQRGPGYARIVNGLIDVGAYQTQASSSIAAGDPKTSRASAVHFYDARTGAMELSMTPFHPSAKGVRVAMGDVSGDGVPDMIVAAGPGGAARVKVFDGITGALRTSFLAYGSKFRGGVYVAAADVNGDGRAEIITGPGAGTSPRVKVFDGRTNAMITTFLARGPEQRHGVLVAAADLDGDRRVEILTGAERGRAPGVGVFDSISGARRTQLFAFRRKSRGGVNVAAGDLDGDGRAEVIVGGGTGRAPLVRILDMRTETVTASYRAFTRRFRGGVRLGTVDTAGNGHLSLIEGIGPGGGTQVNIRDGRTLVMKDHFQAFGPRDRGGVYVAG